MMDKVRVLFVCLGNICRSPMAEAVFSHKVREMGLQDKIEADSAGTGDWHAGERPHKGTMAILAKNAVPYDGRARQLLKSDLETFDYIITMDDANLRGVRGLGKTSAIVSPFLAFAKGIDVREVPDPFYTGNFHEVYELVDNAADGLLNTIVETHDKLSHVTPSG